MKSLRILRYGVFLKEGKGMFLGLNISQIMEILEYLNDKRSRLLKNIFTKKIKPHFEYEYGKVLSNQNLITA